MPIAVRPHDLLRKRIDALINATGHIHEGDVKAVHEARVTSRRLREIVPLIGLDGESSRKLSHRLSAVAKRLGKVRELDVMLVVIDELGCDSRVSSAALNYVGSSVASARVEARERLAAKLPVGKMERLSARLKSAVKRLESKSGTSHRRNSRGPKLAWLLALEARVAHRAGRVRSALETVSTVYLPERLHDVRIALKKLRYAAEILVEAQHTPATGDIETLKIAQDLLGDLHDREVLIEHTRGVVASLPPSDRTGRERLASLVAALEGDCRKLHARCLKKRATLVAIADRMRGAGTPLNFVTRRAVS